MKNISTCIYFFSYLTISIVSYTTTDASVDFFNYTFALTRDLSDSFESSLKLYQPTFPIDLPLAKKQHAEYTKLLQTLVPNVILLDSDSNHPDCNFIEDTAIIIGDTVIISRMGAIERRGEEVAVVEILKKLDKHIIYLQAPGTMDGGDILYTGKHLFVGISQRTNKEAFNQLKNIFNNTIEVIDIPVVEGLHLKSVISCLNTQTILIANNSAGKAIQKQIELLTNNTYKFITVPDAIASNVLRIRNNLIIQDGFPESEKILQTFCNENAIKLIKLNMSELIKADGALTCGCLLFN